MPARQLDNLGIMFSESILNFVIGIKNILYTSLVPFLVRECFLIINSEENLEKLYGEN